MYACVCVYICEYVNKCGCVHVCVYVCVCSSQAACVPGEGIQHIVHLLMRVYVYVYACVYLCMCSPKAVCVPGEGIQHIVHLLVRPLHCTTSDTNVPNFAVDIDTRSHLTLTPPDPITHSLAHPATPIAPLTSSPLHSPPHPRTHPLTLTTLHSSPHSPLVLATINRRRSFS